MEKETIKLDDFIKDGIKSLKISKKNIPKDEIKTIYKCSKCGKGYSEEDKFCSKDGAEIKSEKYTVHGEGYEKFVRDIFFKLSENEIPKDFPYNYEDSIEKRGDGEGYYMNYIFKRKSDNKFFFYTSYDGRIEEKTLDETEKKSKVQWDFERYFS